MNKNYLFVMLTLMSLLVFMGCSSQQGASELDNVQENVDGNDVTSVASSSNNIATTQEITKLKLVNVEDKEYVDAAGMEQGFVTLNKLDTNENITIFTCIHDWSGLVEGVCYEMDLAKVLEDMSAHIYSENMAGCYTGEFTQTDC